MAETITQITQPPEFIEAAAKPYITELQQAVGDFKGADLSKVYGPQFVAGQDPLQTSSNRCCNRCSRFRIIRSILTNSSDTSGSSRSICWTSSLPTIYVTLSTRCN